MELENKINDENKITDSKDEKEYYTIKFQNTTENLPLKFVVEDLGYSPCRCDEYKTNDEHESKKYTNHISSTDQFIKCFKCNTQYKFKRPWLANTALRIYKWGPFATTASLMLWISSSVSKYNYGSFTSVGACVGLFWIACFVPLGVLSVAQYVSDLYKRTGLISSSKKFMKNLSISFMVSPLSMHLFSTYVSVCLFKLNRPLPYTP
jgi:hypothetical protein